MKCVRSNTGSAVRARRSLGPEAGSGSRSDSPRPIPIVVLTASEEEEDVYHTCDLGVNAFVTKPVSFGSMVDRMKTIRRYWLEILELPHKRNGN